MRRRDHAMHAVEGNAPMEEDMRPDPLVVTIQRKVSARVRVVSIAVLIMFAAFNTRWGSWNFDYVGLLLVPVIFFVAAVYLPDGSHPSSCMYLPSVLLLGSFNDCVLDSYIAREHFDEVLLAGGLLKHVHGMRVLIDFYFLFAELLIAYDSWRLMGARLWGQVRCLMAMGSALRLVANWRIRNLDAVASSDFEYLPGKLDFATSLAFNIVCMAISLVLSPAIRHRLSESFGGARVVCSLSELPTPPDRVLGTTDVVRAFAEPLVHHSQHTLQDTAARPAGSQCRESFRSSSSAISSAASELNHALASASDEPSGSASARITLPTYPLLPQFWQEPSVHLPAAMRARLQLQVRDGVLVDSNGALLAPSGQMEGMYVMDEFGSIFTSLCIDQLNNLEVGATFVAEEELRHTSLIGGGPVAAAGMLTVSHGKLLSMSNESGHYAPPPSCLQTMLEQLAGLGVTGLDELDIKIVRRIEYEPAVGPTRERW